MACRASIAAIVGLLLCLRGATAAAQIHSELIAGGLDRPVAFVQDPTQANIQFIVEQHGRIRVLADGALQAADFLDLSGVVAQDTETGLLGLAFPPNAGVTGRFFVNFVDANGNTVIARFARSDARHADPATRFDLVWPDGNAFIGQPACCHYGGNLAFGPDGYLYIGFGDGGETDDPWNNAQNPMTLLGKMARIDVGVADDDPEGYDVPPSNPFVDREGVLPEIWAFGLRNPWRYSFDDPARGGTGALIIGDVGEGQWEEWNYEPAGRGGRNYGWRLREGAHDNITTEPAWSDPLIDPTYQYARDIGRCIIGGLVYRGQALGAAYYGRYFFGDFTGALWSASVTIDPSGEAAAGDVQTHTGEVDAARLKTLVSIGQDAAGELYFLNWIDGTLYRIVAGAVPGGGPGPGSTPAVRGDFNGDQKPDVLWQHPGTGAVLVWTMDGPNFVDGTIITAGGTLWQVVATGDFTGDGKSDIVWQHPFTGEVLLWEMDGTTYVGSGVLNPGGTLWKVVAAADFTGDGKLDLLWQHPDTGAVLLWEMDGTAYVSSTIINAGGTSWKVAAAVDLTGDGHPDLLWQHPVTGAVLLWVMNGPAYVDYAFVNDGPTAWKVVGAADYTGDGKPDLLWQYPGTGAVLLWKMNGPSFVDGTIINPGTAWQIRGPR
jgi:glucose/arabinose dehydrogenase